MHMIRMVCLTDHLPGDSSGSKCSIGQTSADLNFPSRRRWRRFLKQQRGFGGATLARNAGQRQQKTQDLLQGLLQWPQKLKWLASADSNRTPPWLTLIDYSLINGCSDRSTVVSID